MPEQAAKTSKAQEKRESQPREPQSAEAAVALAERAPLAAAGTGDDPSARHAGLLGDARIGRMSVGQRAGLVRQLQRGYGNGHVARAMARAQSSTIAQRAPAETTHMPEESPHAPEQSIGAEAQPQAQTVQRNILGDLGDAVGDVASAVADPRKAFLSKAADFAKNIPGYTMLTLALGKDPISGNAVERNAKNVFHAVLGMVPGGEKIFASLDESGAIDKAFAWLEEQFAQLGLNFDTIKGLFKRAWDALSLTDLADPFGAFEKIKSIFVEPIVRLKNFVTAIGEKVLEFVFEGVMTKLGGGPVMGMLQKAGSALKQIIKDPIGFLSNLLSGVKQGFLNFKEHILSHLGKGLMTWLFGELASGGITLPKSFDLKGILELVMQVLGLTWTNLRAQAAKVLGEKTVARLESGAVAGFKIFKIVSEQGIGGLWEYIKEQIGNLKDMVIDGIKELVTSQVVQAGIQWLIGMLGGPAGALVKAIQTIYNVVMWFVNNASRLTELIGSIGDSIGAIANGAVGQAAKFIETALSNSVPVLLGLLANLLGLGNLSQKIKGVIEKIQAPIKKAMGWVLGKAKGFASKVMGKVKGAFGKKDKAKDSVQSLKVKQDALMEVQSRGGGRFTNISEFSAMISTVYSKYSSKGLKSLTAKGGQKTGKVHVEAVASPAQGADLSPEIVKLSPDQYKAALSMAMPSDALDDTATLIEKIAQDAGKQAAETSDFVALCKAKKWTAAGTRFHSIAAEVARAMVASNSKAIPSGYKVQAEYTVKAGKGGSRIDLYIVKPDGGLIAIDWKTTGRSALGSEKQQKKHQEHVFEKEGRPLADQASRSWVTYVRPHLVDENIDWLRG